MPRRIALLIGLAPALASLEGPGSRATKAFDAEPSHDDAAPYSALAHPELAREDGRFAGRVGWRDSLGRARARTTLTRIRAR
jgi:hypothetical protein